MSLYNRMNLIRILYNNPLVYQKPMKDSSSEIGRGLIKIINEANISIDFALYGLRGQPEILEAIKKAQERGVVVRGVVDKDVNDNNYYDDTEQLINLVKNVETDYKTDLKKLNNPSEFISNSYWSSPNGFNGPAQMVGYSLEGNMAIIAVHASKKDIVFEGDIMHNKFFVIDSHIIWTGSTNVSDTGTGGYNANMACIIDNDKIAKYYEDEFNQMYEMNYFHNDKEINNDLEKIVLNDGTEIEVFFSPQGNVIPNVIRPLINNAKSEINIPIFYLTDKDITGDLIKAHYRGVSVRVLIDATSAQNGYSKHEILRAVGIPVKVENWGGKMHMKSIIVDKEYVVVGSMNFTSAGTRTNDENTIVFRNSYYANEANDNFDILWDSIPDEYLSENPGPESNESINSMEDGVDNDFDSLVDSLDEAYPDEVMLPPYRIVPKEDGYNLIKGIENKNGFMIYILPNSKYYGNYIVDQRNEFYFPSIQEAKAAGFEAFNYKKHILME